MMLLSVFPKGSKKLFFTHAATVYGNGRQTQLGRIIADRRRLHYPEKMSVLFGKIQSGDGGRITADKTSCK